MPQKMNVLRVLLLVGIGVVAVLAARQFGSGFLGVAAAFIVALSLGTAFLFTGRPTDPDALKKTVLESLHDYVSTPRLLASAVMLVWAVGGTWITLNAVGRKAPDAQALVIEVRPSVADTAGDYEKFEQGQIGGYTISNSFPTTIPLAHRVPNPEFRIQYRSEQRGDTTFVTHSLPYLTRLRSGQPIEAIRLGLDGYFSWSYPKLSLVVVNNRPHAVQLSEAVVTVHRSELNNEPIPVIDGMGVILSDNEGARQSIGLAIVNEGWGPLVRPEIAFAVESANPADAFKTAFQPSSPLPDTVRFPAIDSVRSIPLEDPGENEDSLRSSRYIPSVVFASAAFEFSQNRDPGWVAVFGQLRYDTPTGEQRSMPFRTGIVLIHELGAGYVENSYTYGVCLPAGVTGEFPVEIRQAIGSGETDHFTLQVGADRSARFVLSIAFRATGGEIIQAGNVVLEVLVPSRMREGDRRCNVARARSPG